jgi:hypothetical protein
MGCLMLFALPFAAVGVFMGGLTARTLWKASAMRGWDEMPATILTAELETRRGSDSTTYEAVATYRYEVDGQTHTGSRVSIHSGADNVGSFHQDTHNRLRRHLETGQPTVCYVNPRNPEDAVLDRSVRWGMISFFLVFALVFGGVGIGLIVGAAIGMKRVKKEKVQQAEHPESPWLWNPEWAVGTMRSSNKAEMVASIAFASFWNVISWPIAVMVLLDPEVPGQNKGALVVLLFPLVGLGLAIWALRTIMRRFKFGESRFEMASVPGVVGGSLAGIVHIPVHIQPEDGFHLSLNCVHQYTTGSGKNRSTRRDVLWEDSHVVTHEMLEHDFTRSAVPVLFGIPYECRPTDTAKSDDQIKWELKVTAAVPGIDYSATFPVPVFKTADSSPEFRIDESAYKRYRGETDVTDEVRKSGIVVERLTDGGAAIVQPMARNWGTALILTIFFAVWTGVVVLLIKLHAPLIFPIVFGFFDVLIMFGVLDMWLSSSRIEVRHRTLTTRSGMLGIGVTRTYPTAELREMTASRGMQSGSRVFYDVKLVDPDGKRRTIARNLPSRRHAEGVIAMLREAAGDVPW